MTTVSTLQHVRVLLVEDNKINQMLLKKMIETYNFTGDTVTLKVQRGGSTQDFKVVLGSQSTTE